MNGIENIEQKILDEAKLKAESIIKDAEEKAASIASLNEEKTIRDTTLINEKNVLALQDIHIKARQSDQMERRKRLSGERHKIVMEVFSKALDTLLNLDDDKYMLLLCKLAGDAVGENKDGELIFNEKDRAKFGAKVCEKLNSEKGRKVTLSDETSKIEGGVIVRRGDIEYNCDVAVIIRILSEELASEVHDRLFPKGA